jgi:threonyl-tRNA synthetase
VDDRSEKMNYKIREAQVQKVPYMFVVGKVESADPDVNLVSVRHRQAGDLGAGTPLDAWIAKIARLSADRAVTEEQPTPGGVS